MNPWQQVNYASSWQVVSERSASAAAMGAFDIAIKLRYKLRRMDWIRVYCKMQTLKHYEGQ